MKFIFDNDKPIYIQLVEQLEKCIISGNIKSGEKLPSVRELASQAKVNPNTVQKALQELEDKELIYTERTNGKFVTHNISLIEKYKKNYAKQLTSKYVLDMQSIGISISQVIECLKEYGGE